MKRAVPLHRCGDKSTGERLRLGRLNGFKTAVDLAAISVRLCSGGCMERERCKKTGGCHTPAGHQLSAQGGLSGRHTRSDCRGKSRRWPRSRDSVLSSRGSTASGRQILAGHRHNRFKPFIRTDPFYRYNPYPMHDPCHSANRYNRYNQTSGPNAFCRILLRRKAIAFRRFDCSD